MHDHLIDLSQTLDKMTSEIIYLSHSSNLDFRSSDWKLHIYSQEHTATIPVLATQMASFIGVLSSFFKGKTIISWDLKSLMSHFRYRSPVKLAGTFYDLKYAESFLAIEKKKPASWEEANERYAVAKENVSVGMLMDKIYIPLAVDVLPKIETFGIVDAEEMKWKYSSYVIEGQSHGRMSAPKTFPDCFLPHTLSPSDRKKFRLPFEKKFVQVDFKFMEMSVLQWLSNDDVLGKIIESGDIYSEVYRLLSGKPCKTEDQRKLIKDSLLPTFYGIQAESLASNLSISIAGAAKIINYIKSMFKKSIQWVEEQQNIAKAGVFYDYFGRPRRFINPWTARNAAVQGPAAIVCLEKLIDLHNKIGCDIIATIHDAYIVSTNICEVDYLIKEIVKVLEEPSQVCNGLRLKVAVEVGDNLADLKSHKGESGP